MFSRSCCSEDSEISESFINPESTFRVSVSLQRYFKDIRSRCYILVAKNRRVHWLERRLQKIFSLPSSFCLCINGHLLPSAEPLALVRPEESIEVIPLVEVCMGVLHKKGDSILNINNLLEKQTPNGGIALNSATTQLDVFRATSVQNSNQTISNEVSSDKRTETMKEDAGITNPNSKDDTDGANESIINSNMISPSRDINKYNEKINPAHTLQQVKRHALALLDAHHSGWDVTEAATEEPPPRRARRRVRRRARRSLPPEPEPETEPKSRSSAIDSLSESEPLSESSPTVSAPIEEVLPAAAPSPSLEVARNEAACSRRPRVVRSLEVEN